MFFGGKKERKKGSHVGVSPLARIERHSPNRHGERQHNHLNNPQLSFNGSGRTLTLSLCLSQLLLVLAKYTVMVSKHHCGQTFGTCPCGWEGRSPVRRGCGAQPHGFFFDDFWSIFGIFFSILKDRILANTQCQKIWSQRDRKTQYFEAISSRGKD